MTEKIHPTAVIAPTAQIGSNVAIGPFTLVDDGAVIGDNTVLDSHVVIGKNVKIGRNNRIFPCAVIGRPPQILGFDENTKFGGLVIGDNNTIREYVTIHPSMYPHENTVVGNGNLLMINVHLGHDCHLEDKIVISNCTQVSGHCRIDTGAWLSGMVAIHQFVTIGKWSYAAGYTASDLGKPEVYIPGLGFVPFGPGSFIPHSIYCNVGRCLTGEAVFREAEILCDISGGVTATFPHEKDFANPETGELLLKYTKRSPNISAEDQAQFWRYLGDKLCSATGGVRNIGAYQGQGTLEPAGNAQGFEANAAPLKYVLNAKSYEV